MKIEIRPTGAHCPKCGALITRHVFGPVEGGYGLRLSLRWDRDIYDSSVPWRRGPKSRPASRIPLVGAVQQHDRIQCWRCLEVLDPPDGPDDLMR